LAIVASFFYGKSYALIWVKKWFCHQHFWAIFSQTPCPVTLPETKCATLWRQEIWRKVQRRKKVKAIGRFGL
jgi:hypothetical protein